MKATERIRNALNMAEDYAREHYGAGEVECELVKAALADLAQVEAVLEELEFAHGGVEVVTRRSDDLPPPHNEWRSAEYDGTTIHLSLARIFDAFDALGKE